MASQGDDSPVSLLISVAAIALALLTCGLLWYLRAGADDQAASVREAATPGYTTSTTAPIGPFELAESSHRSTATTLVYPDDLEGRDGSPTTTAATTTTTIPGAGSEDGVCAAMASLYDTSRRIDVDDRANLAATVRLYAQAIGNLSQAIGTSSSPTVSPQRSGLLDLTGGVVSLLEREPSAAGLTDAYQRLSDVKNPAVTAMLAHLRSSCPGLADVLERR